MVKYVKLGGKDSAKLLKINMLKYIIYLFLDVFNIRDGVSLDCFSATEQP